MAKCRILLLSAGTNACYHVAKTLKANFKNDFYIIGADINEEFLIPTFNFMDTFYKVPYSNSPDYYSIILEICKNEKVDYILASFDTDQKLFYPENPDLINLGTKSLTTSSNVLKFYEDKEKMNSFLNSLGFKTPKKFNIDEVESDKKYFIKPKNGVGSIGAKVAIGKDIINLEDSSFLIQELCTEPEYTVECFNYNGHQKTITRERIASKAGVCTKTKIFNHFELEEIAKKFAQKASLPYCFNLQFMKNLDNDFVITDVNLRLAGGMSLSYASGWDEVSALAKVMLNKSEVEVFETLPDKIQPQYVVRAYMDIVTKIEKPTVAFDFDGTLLDSRKRHGAVLNDILKQYDVCLETSDLIEYKREGKNNVSYLISKGIDENLAKEIQIKWIDNIEKENYLEMDVLYEDAIENLEKYSKENDLILITARSNKAGLQKQIDKFGLRKYFREIFVVDACQNTCVLKAEILTNEKVSLMIGDTLSDFKASQVSKINFCHYDEGFHKKELINNL